MEGKREKASRWLGWGQQGKEQSSRSDRVPGRRYWLTDRWVGSPQQAPCGERAGEVGALGAGWGAGASPQGPHHRRSPGHAGAPSWPLLQHTGGPRLQRQEEVGAQLGWTTETLLTPDTEAPTVSPPLRKRAQRSLGPVSCLPAQPTPSPLQCSSRSARGLSSFLAWAKLTPGSGLLRPEPRVALLSPWGPAALPPCAPTPWEVAAALPARSPGALVALSPLLGLSHTCPCHLPALSPGPPGGGLGVIFPETPATPDGVITPLVPAPAGTSPSAPTVVGWHCPRSRWPPGSPAGRQPTLQAPGQRLRSLWPATSAPHTAVKPSSHLPPRAFR